MLRSGVGNAMGPRFEQSCTPLSNVDSPALTLFEDNLEDNVPRGLEQYQVPGLETDYYTSCWLIPVFGLDKTTVTAGPQRGNHTVMAGTCNPSHIGDSCYIYKILPNKSGTFSPAYLGHRGQNPTDHILLVPLPSHDYRQCWCPVTFNGHYDLAFLSGTISN